MQCLYCNQNLSERGLFCPSCGKQVRCRECRDVLEPNASACVMCGNPVDQGNSSANYAHNGQNLALNSIRFKETDKERTFDANLTDHAVSEVSQALGQFMAIDLRQGARKRQIVTLPNENIITQPPTELPLLQLDDNRSAAERQPEQVTIDQSSQALKHDSDDDKLRRVFRYDGAQIRLDETRLKAISKRDAVRRVTFLFLYAHDLKGHYQIERSALNKVLQDASLYDSNARAWIKTCTDLTIENEKITIRLTGKEQAKQILNEVLDPNVPNEWTLGTRSTRSRTTQSINGDEAQEADSTTKHTQKKRGGPSRKVTEWIKVWKEKGNQPHANHLKLKDRGLLDQGIVGLWAIRTTVGDNKGKVVSRSDLAQFIYEAFEIKVAERSLERSLKGNKDYVIHVGGIRYQISPAGISYAQGIMTGS